MPSRPYCPIGDVLNDFGVPKAQKSRLRNATLRVVDRYRAQEPEQMRQYLIGNVLPLPLASEFLERHGSKILDKDGKPIWDESKDMNKVREGFANIIGRQIVQREEKSRSKRNGKDNGTEQDSMREHAAKRQRYNEGECDHSSLPFSSLTLQSFRAHP